MTLPPPGTHGGDGPAVARALGLDLAEILDLSQSLNPFAPDPAPVVARHLDAVRDLPRPAPATGRFGRSRWAVEPERLLLTNGGAEAIALLAAELGGRVVEPDFALHPRGGGPSWRSNPHSPSGLLAARRRDGRRVGRGVLPAGHRALDARRRRAGRGIAHQAARLPRASRSATCWPIPSWSARCRARQPAWSVGGAGRGGAPRAPRRRSTCPAGATGIAVLRARLVDAARARTVWRPALRRQLGAGRRAGPARRAGAPRRRRARLRQLRPARRRPGSRCRPKPGLARARRGARRRRLRRDVGTAVHARVAEPHGHELAAAGSAGRRHRRRRGRAARRRRRGPSTSTRGMRSTQPSRRAATSGAFGPTRSPPDVLDRILGAAHAAPSVGHSQPWRFVVVRDPHTRDSAALMADREWHRQAAGLRRPLGRATCSTCSCTASATLRSASSCAATAAPRREACSAGPPTSTPTCGRAPAPSRTSGWPPGPKGVGVGWVTLFRPEELAGADRPPTRRRDPRVAVPGLARRAAARAGPAARRLVVAPAAVRRRALGALARRGERHHAAARRRRICRRPHRSPWWRPATRPTCC